MPGCFFQDDLAQRDFIQGCDVDNAELLARQRIPRWLLVFDRLDKKTLISDVGGDVEGQYYVPADVEVNISAFMLDLERASAPTWAATVQISPSARDEYFLDIDELGQALVTLYSWDGKTARAILQAYMTKPEWGYDGEVTTLRLSEEFSHDPTWPPETEDGETEEIVWADKGIATAKDLLAYLLDQSGYPVEARDPEGIGRVLRWLNNFAVTGKATNATQLMSLIQQRLQGQFLFALWQQAGLLTGTPFDPTAEPVRTLVVGVHLKQLQSAVKEEEKYTAFRVRYDFDADGSDGWRGAEVLDKTNDPYLKEFARRWGDRQFGNPVDKPRDTNAVDLADVAAQPTAMAVLQAFAHLFHRGQTVPYLQLAKFSEIPMGTRVALVDPERRFDEKQAILIGRQWLTPEWLVHTFRPIEPMELEQTPLDTFEPGATSPFGAEGFSSACWSFEGGPQEAELVTIGGATGIRPVGGVSGQIYATLGCSPIGAQSCALSADGAVFTVGFGITNGFGYGLIIGRLCDDDTEFFNYCGVGGNGSAPEEVWNFKAFNFPDPGEPFYLFMHFVAVNPGATFVNPFIAYGPQTPVGSLSGSFGLCSLGQNKMLLVIAS